MSTPLGIALFVATITVGVAATWWLRPRFERFVERLPHRWQRALTRVDELEDRDQETRRELHARRERQVALLKQQAHSSRHAARKYGEHLKREIQALRELERDSVVRKDADLLRQLQSDIHRLEAELARAKVYL